MKIDSKRILDVILMGVIVYNLIGINRNLALLTNAIVDQHICKVVGNPEDVIKLALKGKL